MTFTVRPSGEGGWFAFVSGPRILLTPASDSVVVDAAFLAISEADGFRLSLDHLTSRGLAATPQFVLVEWVDGAEARIIIRGDTPLTVVDATGRQSLSAAGVSTWVERSIQGVAGIAFSVPGATPIGSASLPLHAGVALVAQVTLGETVPATPEPVPATPEDAAPTTPVVVPEVDVEATVRDAPAPEPIPEPAPEPAEVSDDNLVGDTQFRPVPEAPARVPAETEPEVDDTLHDGETVLTSDIAKIRGKRRPAKKEQEPQHLVLAVSTTGARESLAQPILVGRSPSVSKISGGQIPRLLTVGTPDQDISRNHVQVTLEGGTVVVTDLHSRNGTMIELPGKSPQKLRAGEPTSVILGTVIDLGSGVTLTVEEGTA